MSKSLDPDEAGHFVEAHLGPNCLQNLSADDPSGKEPAKYASENIVALIRVVHIFANIINK